MTATTEIRHGYTMRDLDAMTKQACRADRSLASDVDTRYNTAWSAIALALCEAEEAPDRHDLVTTGWQAIYREVKQMRGLYGFKDRDGTTEVASAQRFRQYWTLAPTHPDEDYVERIAVHQILDTLGDTYRNAVIALAVHDDYQTAADSLGIKYTAFTARMTVARRRFRALWFAPETAPPARGTDRRIGSRTTELRTHCSAGHELTPDNIYRRPNPKPGRRGERRCKTCEQLRGRARVAARRASPAPDEDALVSDLPDLSRTPLADLAAAAHAGDTTLDETLRRIAPRDGRHVLLVAAAFNSSI